MNSKFVSAVAIAAASSAGPAVQPSNGASASVAAANLLLADLERGRAIDARVLRTAMTASFGGSDAEGAWSWKTAYDACEAAQILFLRKFGPAMRERAASPPAFLAMLTKLAALVPSHTRRSEESQALQQFSTPIGLGFVASAAAAITPADLVLEPSAGTGLLAIHAELAGGSLVLNELADTRARSARPPVPRRRRHPVRRRPHSRPSRRRRASERRADEPALLGRRPCGRPRCRRSAPSPLVRAGASRRRRPPGRHYGREPFPQQSILARRLRSIAGTWPRGVFGGGRWAGLCPSRHQRRDAPDRHRPRTRGRSDGVSGVARDGERHGHVA